MHDACCNKSSDRQEPMSVSVVMCTYNGAPWLREQMDTILAQTYPLHEIIVQDDGSTDDTWHILQAYAAQHPCIRLFRNEENKGYNDNFFSAMERATGDWIALADQDNLWETDKIARQMAAVGQHLHAAGRGDSIIHPPQFVLCSHKTKPFNDDGTPAYYDPRTPNTGLLRLVFQTEMHGHTLLFHRSLLQVVDTRAALLRYTAYDVLLELSAAAAGSVVFLPEPLTRFRRHETAATLTEMSSSSRSWRNAVGQFTFCLRHYRTLRRRSRADYLAVIDYLDHLPYPTKAKQQAIRMLTMRTSGGAVNFLRFQCFCLKHRHEIFYTPGKGIANAIRAWLYPILCLHYKRRYVGKGELCTADTIREL